MAAFCRRLHVSPTPEVLITEVPAHLHGSKDWSRRNAAAERQATIGKKGRALVCIE